MRSASPMVPADCKVYATDEVGISANVVADALSRAPVESSEASVLQEASSSAQGVDSFLQ